MLVLVIVAILATIAIVGWRPTIEREYDSNARATLELLLRAEDAFYAWKGRFTSDWTALEVDDPNISDSAYTYKLENVTDNLLFIRATRNNQTRGFVIDQNGTITKF